MPGDFATNISSSGAGLRALPPSRLRKSPGSREIFRRPRAANSAADGFEIPAHCFGRSSDTAGPERAVEVLHQNLFAIRHANGAREIGFQIFEQFFRAHLRAPFAPDRPPGRAARPGLLLRPRQRFQIPAEAQAQRIGPSGSSSRTPRFTKPLRGVSACTTEYLPNRRDSQCRGHGIVALIRLIGRTLEKRIGRPSCQITCADSGRIGIISLPGPHLHVRQIHLDVDVPELPSWQSVELGYSG
jgi:hypothetical protein